MHNSCIIFLIMPSHYSVNPEEQVSPTIKLRRTVVFILWKITGNMGTGIHQDVVRERCKRAAGASSLQTRPSEGTEHL